MTQDDTEAVRLFAEAAAQGYSLALYNLAWHQEEGLGTARDVAAAIQNYRLAKAQGISLAEGPLARLAGAV